MFANNYFFSIDNIIGLSKYNYTVLVDPIPEIILATLLSLTFFSAAIEKIDSKSGKMVVVFIFSLLIRSVKK